MIMKLNKIYAMFAATAVVFGLTACADTDAQYDVAVASVPEYVSVSPSVDKALLFGEKTIKVKFNRKVNFATKNTDKITLNGKAVKKALVLGADSSLTITVDVNFDKKQNLVIPANLIANAQGAYYDKEINLTWEIKDLPTNEATAMTQKLGWGFNLGNHFDTTLNNEGQWPGYWDQAIPTQTFYQMLASYGAKTVRIPATWTAHMDDNMVIDAAYLNEVAQNVDWAIAAGLNVILNTHHDAFESGYLGNAATNPAVAAEANALIEAVWGQIATKFKDYNEQLIFETFNEVHNGDDWSKGSAAQFATLNAWNQLALNTIRATGGKNATRWIGVSGYAANIDLTIANLVLPEDPANHIMVGVHCYDPYNFCLAPYNTGDEVSVWGHGANGTNDEESYVINQLYKLRTAYINNNIPCYLGEYGCVWKNTDVENAYRAYYLEFYCRAANLAGIPMFVWDNNAKNSGNEANGYLDHANGQWLNDSETMVPTMIKACTSTDSSYTLQTIWNKSPLSM